MIRNYFIVAFRNLRRNPGYSFINIVGLATGMAAFILILLFVNAETQYDTEHDQPDNVFRIVLDAAVMGQTVKSTNTSAPLAPTLLDEFPEVEASARIDDFSNVLVSYEDNRFYESQFFLADSSIFKILNIPLASGDPETALTRPNTVVISAPTARKFFGDDDPIGKVLRIDDQTDYEVTGVMAPPPGRSHFEPELIGSFITSSQANATIWFNNSFVTYLRLKPGSDPAALEAKFPVLIDKYVGPQVPQLLGQSFEEARASGLKYDFVLENVRDIYLHSDADGQLGVTGNIQYVFILGAIGIFVLAIACINFMNLSTARATNRAREVGMRKVLGSAKRQLITQFIGESLLLAGISIAIAIAIVSLVLPLFNSTMGSNVILGPDIIIIALVVAIGTGVASGIYPAFVLSSYAPITVLKGRFNAGFKGSRLRSSLVVFQFAISIVLIVGTAVVFKQLRFLQNQDLGFSKEHVVVIPLEAQMNQERFETLREQLLQNPDIVEVASAGAIPGPEHIHNTTVFVASGRPADEVFLAAAAEVSYEYVQALGLTIVAGRNFSRDFPADIDGWLINESAAAEMNWSPEEAVGKLMIRPDGEDDGDRVGTIIGVMKDFHYESFHTEIQPIVFGLRDSRRYLPVRLSGANTADAMAFLESSWTTFEPAFPFQYFFLDQEYQRFYVQEHRLGRLYSSFTILAILIACLGLFGLASFVTSQRTREIGVRKVLGASVSKIVILLSKEFTLLVAIACAVAFPISWLAMKRWLQDFAYATEIGWQVFVLSAIAAILIAWITVGYQSIRAAVANPVKSLRTE